LIEALREVHQGEKFFSPEIARRFSKQHQKTPDRNGRVKTKVTHLSSREVEVLQLIAEGEANKQIADELGISTKTVEKHRDHLMQKLDIHDTASLTRYAIATGIIKCTVPLTIIKSGYRPVSKAQTPEPPKDVS
jgi:DNA-binding NarL/FixJ family response regulator